MVCDDRLLQSRDLYRCCSRGSRTTTHADSYAYCDSNSYCYRDRDCDRDRAPQPDTEDWPVTEASPDACSATLGPW